MSVHPMDNTSSSDSSSSSSSLVFKKKRMAVTAILLTGEKQASAMTLTVLASFLYHNQSKPCSFMHTINPPTRRSCDIIQCIHPHPS